MTRPLNPLARRASRDSAAADRLKTLTRELLDLPDDVVVTVAELSCCKSGCPETETVVALLAAGEKARAAKFPKPMREINVLELSAALRQLRR